MFYDVSEVVVLNLLMEKNQELVASSNSTLVTMGPECLKNQRE